MGAAMRKDGLHHIFMGFNRVSLSGKDDLSTLKSSLFNLFPYARQQDAAGGASGDKRKNVETLLASAQSMEEMQEIISDAIVHRMGALVANDNIDLDSPIADLGVDSLIAIELKNWLNRIFKAVIQTSEILESPTLRTLAVKVLEKADVRPKEGNSAQVTQVSAPSAKDAILAEPETDSDITKTSSQIATKDSTKSANGVSHEQNCRSIH